MTIRSTLAALAALAAAACAVTPTPSPGPAGAVAASGPARIGAGALDLGDWRRDSQQAVAARFSQSATRRYGAGLALSEVQADLARSDFRCAPSHESRGDPPDAICRRTVTLSGCTHTWQVHVFDDAGQARLARLRALYDRRCAADDGLLGGPQ